MPRPLLDDRVAVSFQCRPRHEELEQIFEAFFRPSHEGNGGFQGRCHGAVFETICASCRWLNWSPQLLHNGQQALEAGRLDDAVAAFVAVLAHAPH